MEHTYKITEIVGSSPDGIDDAIRNGIGRAAKTLRNLDWFEVTDIRGAMGERRRSRLVPGDDEGRVPPRRRRLTSLHVCCRRRSVRTRSACRTR